MECFKDINLLFDCLKTGNCVPWRMERQYNVGELMKHARIVEPTVI